MCTAFGLKSIYKCNIINHLCSTCRNLPKELHVQEYAHKGPLSKLVTTTTPCNPFNKTTQMSQLTSGIFVIWPMYISKHEVVTWSITAVSQSLAHVSYIDYLIVFWHNKLTYKYIYKFEYVLCTIMVVFTKDMITERENNTPKKWICFRLITARVRQILLG